MRVGLRGWGVFQVILHFLLSRHCREGRDCRSFSRPLIRRNGTMKQSSEMGGGGRAPPLMQNRKPLPIELAPITVSVLSDDL